MKIAIVGAGVSGLTAAYQLVKKGHQVVVFEKNDFLGGLASGFKLGDWYLERFYHHIFKSDQAVQDLAEELELKDLWLWEDCGAPIFYQGKIYPFTTPVDLLKFSPLSLKSRLRTGIVSLFLKLVKNYHYWEKETAGQWLKKTMGEESYQVVWQPLLKKKFSQSAEKIIMSWMWARIHKRSQYLGYPRGGFQLIVNKLGKEIEKRKGKIVLNQKIDSLNQLDSFEKVVFTVAPSAFLKIIPQKQVGYCQQLKKIGYLGTVSLILVLKKPLTDWVYWLNINDLNIPFVACVQQSNLISKENYNDLHPLYLTSYLSPDSEEYKEKPEKIVTHWSRHLEKINPDFRQKWIKKWFLFKEPLTQPVFTLDNYNLIPQLKTPLKNIYLANMTQVYPWDRGVNYAVELGQKIAKEIFNS